MTSGQQWRYIQVADDTTLTAFVKQFIEYRKIFALPATSPSKLVEILGQRLRLKKLILRALAWQENHELFAIALIQPFFSSLALRDCWLIQDLYVAPSYRQRQFATLLLHSIEKEAKQQSIFSLRIQTRRDNFAAMHLYDKTGFNELPAVSIRHKML